MGSLTLSVKPQHLGMAITFFSPGEETASVLSWELCQSGSTGECTLTEDALGKRVSTDIGTPSYGHQSLFGSEVSTESPVEGPLPELSLLPA